MGAKRAGSNGSEHYEVIIVGAGIAGLALARQLLLAGKEGILLLDRLEEIPPARQKVGESLVQMSGYYFSKVLDLEEHLLTEHYLKYNLRFYWKTPGRDNGRFEDFSAAYIRKISNVASYQLDRNKIEAELLRLNLERAPAFRFVPGAQVEELDLSENGGPHRLRFTAGGGDVEATADWVVDTTGRGKLLAKRLGLKRRGPIRHGASFCWVEGLVNIEKLTDRSWTDVRLRPERSALGHIPVFLATNHFMGEGFWFWVIPLQGKTSLGLVYDRELFPHADRVRTQEGLLDWIYEEFPLFARDLPQRRLLGHGGYRDFGFDCARTISPHRWALSGEAGRFSDPLYSPGGDLIAIHNTLIGDAILTGDPDELAAKARIYEQLARAAYEAYVPSYAVSYDALGDLEVFSLKYTWELSVYFSFYVFPMINDLFTDRRFIVSFLRRFSQLGAINRGLHALLSGYYRWKKERGLAGRGDPATGGPIFHDFTRIGALVSAESCFYRVGLGAGEARRVLDGQLENLRELARFITAHVAAVVLDEERVLTHRGFVEGIDLENLAFDPEAMARRYADCRDTAELYDWAFDPGGMDRFRAAPGGGSPPGGQKAVAAGAPEVAGKGGTA